MVLYGMLLLRRLELAIADDEPVGELARRVHAALAGAGAGDTPRRIWFEATGARGPAMCRRVLDAAPVLAPTAQGSPVSILSSFDERVGAGTPACQPDLPSLERIADGIPGRFPLPWAVFYYGPVPALQLAADPGSVPARTRGGGFADPGAAEILLFSAGGTSRRKTRLGAGVILDAPPPEAKKLPPLPAPTQQLIDALGKVGRQSQVLIGVGDEVARTAETSRRLEAVNGAIAVELAAWARTAIFPHHVVDDVQHGDSYGPVKDVLSERLRPLGYRYQGKAARRGVWTFTKRTAHHNELELSLDRGPMGGRMFAVLSLGGPLWSNGMRVPLAPDRDEVKVWSEDTCRRVADNLAFSVEWLEERLVPAIEPHRPPGCAWFSRVAF